MLGEILVNKLRKLHFQERSKRQIITEFIIIITPSNKFSFKSILEWILIVN